jgi:genome maintenance exonuclease 1
MPKFDYPNISSANVSGLRVYETLKGNFYPSITTVLGNSASQEKIDSLNAWKNNLGDEADSITKEAADKGTAVHLLAERFLNGEKLINEGETFSEDAIKSFNGLKLKLKKVSEVWGQEVALYSDAIQVAGRCDCIGIYNGKECIIDFKTSRRIKHKKDIEDYFLQLAAYSIMHNEMFGTNIVDGVIIMSSMNGFPQEFNVNLEKYYDSLLQRINKFYTNLSI